MLFLTSAPTRVDNMLTLGLVAMLALVVVIAIIRKAVSKKKAAATPAPVEETAQVEVSQAPGSAGQVKLHNVPPKTAAMLMAIAADKMKKPLNELRFISIKEVE